MESTYDASFILNHLSPDSKYNLSDFLKYTYVQHQYEYQILVRWLVENPKMKAVDSTYTSEYTKTSYDPFDETTPYSLSMANKNKVISEAQYGLYHSKLDGMDIWFYIYSQGVPVASMSGVSIYKALTMYINKTKNKRKVTKELVEGFVGKIIKNEEEKKKDSFKVYYMRDHCYHWSFYGEKPSRSRDTLFNNGNMKDELLKDAAQFKSQDAYDWFIKHSIPYKKCYLFHGPPGTGKTSMIHCMASELNMNVCYFQPSLKDLQENNIAKCIEKAPGNSIMVMEDIDMYFDNQHGTVFSSFINILDGITCPFGQIFILTTNNMDKMKGPLCRSSRIDMSIEFDFPNSSEMRKYYLSFYEKDEDGADKFMRKLANRKLSIASLQNIFTKNYNKSNDDLIKWMEQNTHFLNEMSEETIKEGNNNFMIT